MNVRYFYIKRRGLYICDTFSAYNPYVNRLRFLLHLTHQFWSFQTSGMSKCRFCFGYQYFGGALPKSWRPVIFVIPENAGNKLYPNFGTWIHSTRILYCRRVEFFFDTTARTSHMMHLRSFRYHDFKSYTRNSPIQSCSHFVTDSFPKPT